MKDKDIAMFHDQRMLREVLDKKSSLIVAKRIYSNELKLGVYPNEDDMLKHTRKSRKWVEEDDKLQPYEKLERVQRYTKSLVERSEKKKQLSEMNGDRRKMPNLNSDLRSNRMETLFQLYADQTSDSYRIAARRKYFLPPLTNVLKVLGKNQKVRQNCVEEKEEENTTFPKLPDRNSERQ